MSEPHYYRGLDAESRLTVSVSMRELAEQVVALSYGAHRLLSHLVDVRREALAERARRYRAEGADDVAASIERIGDPLADGIEALLKAGFK